MDDKITLVTFTDPMMGLSYECEPIFRKLETHFAGKIEFHFVMSGLVRDVYELVDPEDLKVSKEFAIKNYNVKLAEIYSMEENLGGLPINMTGFELFSVNETSSDPLNIAYKAAQISNPDKAENFLYNLRYATIVDCRPTTKLQEILKVAIKTGLNVKNFLAAFNDGSAEKAFQSDLQTCRRLGIHSLPSYLIQFKSQGALAQNLIDYETFAKIFSDLSGGEIKPVPPQKNIETLQDLLRSHPLISHIELREAFDFSDTAQVRNFIAPLIDSGEVKIINVPRGRFYQLGIRNLITHCFLEG
ncbi:MAG: DsbA family protein [Selenomonadaceae bacterium]|nr:DsbA family protein [Selenomonadaceae bacterium]